MNLTYVLHSEKMGTQAAVRGYAETTEDWHQKRQKEKGVEWFVRQVMAMMS